MSAAPKYLALAEQLRRRVAEQAVGTPVPSERDLATDAGVSRMTARKAVELLVAEGRIAREVGRGSFVTRPALSMPLTLTSFTVAMQERGRQAQSRVISARVAAAGDRAEAFGVETDEPLVLLDRVRLAEDRPMAIERAAVLAAVAPGLLDAADFASDSLYAVLATQYGVHFDAGDQVIRAALLSAPDAALLDAEAGEPTLELIRTSTRGGRVLERTVSTYPADRFELKAAITPTRARESAAQPR